MSNRSRGISVTASRPSRSSSQKRSGVVELPGRRQPMPMIAIGSGSRADATPVLKPFPSTGLVLLSRIVNAPVPSD